MDEATRTKCQLSGRLRLGAGSNANHAAIGGLLAAQAEHNPGIDVALRHGTPARSPLSA